MNRTDRLYALVEELRAFAPRPGTAHQAAPVGWFGTGTDDPHRGSKAEGSAEQEKRSCYEG